MAGWQMDRFDNRGTIGVNRLIALNNRRDKFKDPRVREALTLAVDFEWQNRVLHFGQLERALSNFSGEPSFEARGLPGEGELALLERRFAINCPKGCLPRSSNSRGPPAAAAIAPPSNGPGRCWHRPGGDIADGVLVNSSR